MITEAQLLIAEKIEGQREAKESLIKRAIRARVCPKCGANLIRSYDKIYGYYDGHRCSNNPTFIERVFLKRSKTCDFKGEYMFYKKTIVI